MVYRICGCRIYMSEHPNLFVPMVEYCSMHEAAPKLLEACEAALIEIIILTDEIPEYHPDYLAAAIAAAKGGDE